LLLAQSLSFDPPSLLGLLRELLLGRQARPNACDENRCVGGRQRALVLGQPPAVETCDSRAVLDARHEQQPRNVHVMHYRTLISTTTLPSSSAEAALGQSASPCGAAAEVPLRQSLGAVGSQRADD
jgi:hypothetical protein